MIRTTRPESAYERTEFARQFTAACEMSRTLACVRELLGWSTSTKAEILASMNGTLPCAACGMRHGR